MIKLFTHTDLDGVGCAILARLAFGDKVDIEYCNYDTIDKQVDDFVYGSGIEGVKMVYITDISINNTKLIKTINAIYDHKFKLFDHHTTADHLNDNHWCTVAVYNDGGIRTCGAELFYDYLVNRGYLKGNNVIQKFVNAVRDYDTWRWETLDEEAGKEIKQFNDLLYILGRDEFIGRCMTRFKGNKNVLAFSKSERELLDRRQAEIDAYIETKRKQLMVWQWRDHESKKKPNKRFGIVFTDRFISELGNRLCEERSDLDFIMLIDMGAMKMSYRSIKDDVDVSVIAKAYGGGGHKAASGNHFDLLDADRCLGCLFESMLLNKSDKDYIPIREVNAKKHFWGRLMGRVWR